MPNGIGKQLATGIISDYYQKGGRYSGAIGLLENILKQREERRATTVDITKSLLGVKEVGRGVAEKMGLPYKESEEDIQARKYRGLQIQNLEQDIAGTSPTSARRMATAVLDDLQRNTANVVLAIRSGMNREQFIQSARNQLLDLYDKLPSDAQRFFDESVGDLYDTNASAFGKGKKKPQATPTSPGRYKVTPYSE